ncbi:MAG: vanadium-dependent haloperoxidase [Bacteroidetes bacterium]|nr:vanadium-dependent haloperoxidase [Bacteroidota bacterium]
MILRNITKLAAHTKTRFGVIFISGLLIFPQWLKAQNHSVAREWIETILETIKREEGRPTVHARNLFHATVAMYDAWAVYDGKATPYILGQTLGDFSCSFEGFELPENLNRDSARDVTISYAAYRVSRRRFDQYSSQGRTLEVLDSTLQVFGLNERFYSTDYSDGSPAALGNYIAECIINFGLQDGSHEEDQHENYSYRPFNPPLKPEIPGNSNLKNPNRWQPILSQNYVDQRGLDSDLFPWNYLSVVTQGEFLTADWGEVRPFSLTEKDKKGPNQLYLDPGPPPFLNYEKDSLASEAYKWGFLLVALWSSHHDPADSVKIDISPGVRGNYDEFPQNFTDYPDFYHLKEGGVKTLGHKRNPYTGKPYAPNKVLRGDYSRTIAEFWVDGVNSVTPPGHWFKTLNYVNDHPLHEKKWGGKGKPLDQLEWDIKAYLTLGGALHDAAIASWGVKAHYDYIRPISAIRFMADKGQCTDPDLPHYHQLGLPLIEGFIELVNRGDPLVGKDKEHLHKIKIRSWKGPEYIKNPRNERAGVDWILAENWWPYQRYSFATPNFAGYVSGHSTFSTAAAEVLTLITGDPFFPGGIAEFTAKKNQFLLFEDGPSQDLLLQWATYHDAANETCLSRLWGGIHPPADDMEGRKMGKVIGMKVFGLANQYFQGK